MSDKEIFTGFSEEQQAAYAKEAEELYDPQLVRESNQRWKDYGKEKQRAIMAEASQIYTDLVALLDRDPASPEVQAVMARWHQNMRHFYEPTPEILRGLGQHYHSDPRFSATFQKFHPDLAPFLERAVLAYVETLE